MIGIYIPIWIDLKVDGMTYSDLAEKFIYIPIWIDLKGGRQKAEKLPHLYLHSNMDRFERAARPRIWKICARIYIPIWIDLKEMNYFQSTKRGLIYIPIWIDLKVSFRVRVAVKLIIIYIPIWIDLKVEYISVCLLSILHIYIPIWIDLSNYSVSKK